VDTWRAIARSGHSCDWPHTSEALVCGIRAGALVCPPDPADWRFATLLPFLCVVRVVLCLRRSLQRPRPVLMMHRSPSCHRPAGTACVTLDADRSAGASHEVSLASLRRSLVAPYRLEWPTPSHPASAFFQPRHPRQEVGSPMRFLAPRVSGAFQLRFGDAAARVIRGRFLSGLRTGPAPDCYRDLAGTVKVPATSMGFTTALRSFASARGWRRLSTSRAHMPFHHLLPRVSSSRGPPLVAVGREFVAAAPGVWPRRNEPCRVICRPRYSFYA